MIYLDMNGAYVGDSQVEKICLGTDVVWESKQLDNNRQN